MRGSSSLDIIGTYYGSFLPQPTGPYSIGTETMYLIDENRDETFTENLDDKREIILQLWYPTDIDTGKENAAYMDELTFNWLRHQSPIPLFWIPEHAYMYVNPHGLSHAPISSKNDMFPVIIFSHGYDGVRAIYTSLIEELASHGFVVAAINHPYVAGITVFPDGRVVELVEVPSDPSEAETYFETAFRAVVEDIRFVLDHLIELNETNVTWKHRLDISKVGVYGHSFGGGASAVVCSEDSRFLAGVALDGFVGTDDIEGGLETPFLMMLAEGRFNDSRTLQMWTMLHDDGYRVEITGSTHYGYTDVGILLTHFTPLLPQENLGFGTIIPKRLVKIANSYILAFFDVYLKGKPVEILLSLENSFEEVVFAWK
jgi:dienelactone hydrolase